jgi:prevent-host-death family protein
MDTVNITQVRQEATRLVEHVRRTHRPILVIQRSCPAAYLVDATDFEALQQELRDLRHQLFWQDVAAAQAEHRAGQTRVYDSADDLIADLELQS